MAPYEQYWRFAIPHADYSQFPVEKRPNRGFFGILPGWYSRGITPGMYWIMAWCCGFCVFAALVDQYSGTASPGMVRRRFLLFLYVSTFSSLTRSPPPSGTQHGHTRQHLPIARRRGAIQGGKAQGVRDCPRPVGGSGQEPTAVEDPDGTLSIVSYSTGLF